MKKLTTNMESPITNHQIPIKKLKVLTVVGTRPEIIRLSRVILKLDSTESIEHRSEERRVG